MKIYYQQKLEKAQVALKLASDNGDIDAFIIAETDVNNYVDMLNQLKNKS